VKTQNVARDEAEKAEIERIAAIMNPRLKTTWETLYAAPTSGAATTSEDAPSEKQAKLRALADRIDPEKLWTVPLMDRDKLSEAGRDRLDAGVMLRRYAEFFGPGRWVLIPPTGSVQFSAGSLEKVAEMAKADLDRKAMRATQQEGGNAGASATDSEGGHHD
jgi:hypothetical protein